DQTPYAHPQIKQPSSPYFFISTATPPPKIHTLSLHDALPISGQQAQDIDHLAERRFSEAGGRGDQDPNADDGQRPGHPSAFGSRSEEHTSELQSLAYLVCRLLLEKKKMYAQLRHPHRSPSISS